VAPSGQLTASRVPGTNTNRSDTGLYEGPVWIKGALYFSDFSFNSGFPSRIQTLGADGVMRTFIDNSGSNGLAVDNNGNILAATHDKKAISRYNLSTKAREIIVGQYSGNPFNSPNDIAMSSKGIIYFTDPDFQKSAAAGGQSQTRAYQYDGQTVKVIEQSLYNPNGIALSPDELTLYISGNGVLRAYPIEGNSVGSGINLASVTSPDGMAIDCLGNIYVAEHDQKRLRVISPAGTDIATIKVDANVTNAAFGGANGKTLYITGAGILWKIDLNVVGKPY